MTAAIRTNCEDRQRKFIHKPACSDLMRKSINYYIEGLVRFVIGVCNEIAYNRLKQIKVGRSGELFQGTEDWWKRKHHHDSTACNFIELRRALINLSCLLIYTPSASTISMINSNLDSFFRWRLDEPEIPLCKKGVQLFVPPICRIPLQGIKSAAVPSYFRGASNTRSSRFRTCIIEEGSGHDQKSHEDDRRHLYTSEEYTAHTSKGVTLTPPCS